MLPLSVSKPTKTKSHISGEYSASSMKCITFADGTTVPHIAFGSGTALLRQECAANILTALNAGFRHIDTAQRYGNEDSVGKAIKEFLSSNKDVERSDLFITTKIRILEEGQTVEDSLRGSLMKLGLDYVDSFLIHAPIGWETYEGGLSALWSAMLNVRRKGLAKTVGVSNFGRKNLEEIMVGGLEPPSINQLEYHLLVAEKLEPLLQFSKAHGIVTSSYGGMVPIISQPFASVIDATPEDVRNHIITTLMEFASRRGPQVTINQVLMKWILQKGVLVVTTSRSDSRIQEYVATDDIADLTEEEMGVLQKSTGRVHFRALKVASFIDEQ